MDFSGILITYCLIPYSLPMFNVSHLCILNSPLILSAFKQISHYMIPRYVQFVDSYPLTTSGKVQKFKLREKSIKQLNLTWIVPSSAISLNMLSSKYNHRHELTYTLRLKIYTSWQDGSIIIIDSMHVMLWNIFHLYMLLCKKFARLK